MGNKPKILKTKPEVSDEEIKSYMDFEQLLAKRNKMIASKERAGMGTKLIGGASSVLILAALTFFYYQNRPATLVIVPKGDSKKVRLKTETPKIINDSSIEKDVPLNTHSIIKDIELKPDEVNKTETKEDKKRIENTKNSNIQGETGIESNETENVLKENTGEDIRYQQAEPSSGYPTLYTYFDDHLVYPLTALKDSIEGVSIVNFVIDKMGMPGNIEVSQSLGALFDAEAVRLIENMPAWKPALLDDKPVPSKVSVPLTFHIKRNKKTGQ